MRFSTSGGSITKAFDYEEECTPKPQVLLMASDLRYTIFMDKFVG
jgi:hypothetical protein